MLRSAIKSGFLQGTGFMAGFVVHIFLARFLSIEGYGIYNFIIALSGVLALFAAFGLPQATIRYMQRYISAGNSAGLKGLLRFVRAWPVFWGLVLGLGIYGLLTWLGHFSDFESLALLLIGALLVPLLALVPVHAAILRGFNKITLSVFFETTFRDTIFVLILLGFFAGGFSLHRPAEALLIVMGILFLRAALTTYNITRADGQTISSEAAIYEKKLWLGTAWPMMLTAATRLLMVRTDLIVLGLMVALSGLSNADLGVYAAAAKFAMLMALAQMAVMPFFAPNAARLFQTGKREELRALFFKAQKLQLLGGTVLLAGFFIGGKFLLALLGPEYMAGYSAFMILVIGQFIGAACGPSSGILEMTAYEKQAMKVVMVFAGLNLVLTPLLIYAYGIKGAAIATAFSFAGQNLVCYGVAWRKGLIGFKDGA